MASDAIIHPSPPTAINGGLITFRTQGLTNVTELPIAEREQNLALLHETYQQASAGNIRFVWIEGEVGSGKTPLIQRFRQQVVEAHPQSTPLFCQGKYVPHKSIHEPYSGIVAALNQVIAWIQKTQHAQEWKEKISNELVDELPVLEVLLPSLHFFLGEQQESSYYHGNHQECWGNARIKVAVCALLRILSGVSAQGAMIMALHDVHWADQESFEVLKELLIEHDNGEKIMIVCSHRPVDPDFKLKKIQRELHPEKSVCIRMRSLNEGELHSWLSKILVPQTDTNFDKFVKTIYQLCDGNPFFAMRFLHLLETEEVIWQAGDSYDWDEEKLEAYVGLNIVNVTARIMKQHADDVQIAMITAACMDFCCIVPDLLFYALTANKERCIVQSIKQTERLLERAVQDGFLRKCNESGSFEFEHDLFRAAALSLIPSYTEKQHIHLQIGRHFRELVDTLPDCRRDQNLRSRLLLHAVYQMNLGIDVAGKYESMKLQVELNYQAADVAMKRLNFSAGRSFLDRARSALGSRLWDEGLYDVTLRVLTLLSRCLYCSGELTESVMVADDIIKRAKSVDDAAQGGYDTKINCLIQQRKFDLSQSTCLEILFRYNIKFPRKCLGIRLKIEERRARALLSRTPDETILSMRPATNSKVVNMIHFMYRLLETLTVSQTKSLLAKIAIVRLLLLTIRYGFVDATCFALACWGMNEIENQNVAEAYRYGLLANMLAKRTENVQYNGRASAIFHFYISHWRRPVWESLATMRSVLCDYWRHGLIENYFLEAFALIFIAFASGESLEQQIAFISRHEKLELAFNQHASHEKQCPLYQMLANLSGSSACNVIELTGEYMQEQSYMESIMQHSRWVALSQFYWAKLTLSVLFHDMETAARATDRLEEVAKDARTAPGLAFRYFYIGIAHYSLAHEKKEARYWKVAERARSSLKRWVDKGATSYEHMHLLLLAESAVAKGNESKDSIIDMYQGAILGAAGQGMTHNEALGNERLGRFLMREGALHHHFSCYMTKAEDLYTRWGCLPKAAQIRTLMENVSDLSYKSMATSTNPSGTVRTMSSTTSIDTFQ